MLDLSQFTSVEDATRKVEPGERYIEIGKLLLPHAEGRPLTMPLLFFLSMITRSQGLHSAIAREIREGNPHAVFPLVRAFAEAVTLVIYVTDDPGYIDLISARASELPKTGPKRKSMQKLITHASKHAPGLKNVYAELSEATHFGAVAMWAAHAIEDEDDGVLSTSWTSYPRWRSDDQALIACAQTLELADAMGFFLRRFAVRHLGVPAAETDEREAGL
jgi:hypothetical protein